MKKSTIILIIILIILLALVGAIIYQNIYGAGKCCADNSTLVGGCAGVYMGYWQECCDNWAQENNITRIQCVGNWTVENNQCKLVCE